MSDDYATSWRDLADQLTERQVMALEHFEHDTPGTLLWTARCFAAENLEQLAR